MKPAPFDYYAPSSVAEALGRLSELGYDGKVLAGGQSLIPAMNFRMAQPGALVDLNNIKELDYIHSAPDGGLLIGTMTRDSKVEHDPMVAQRVPIVLEATANLAQAQWTQLQSCTLTNGLLSFSDSEWTKYPSRFYRTRSP